MEVLYGFETGEAKRDNTRTLHPPQPPFAFGSGGWWVLTFPRRLRLTALCPFWLNPLTHLPPLPSIPKRAIPCLLFAINFSPLLPPPPRRRIMSIMSSCPNPPAAQSALPTPRLGVFAEEKRPAVRCFGLFAIFCGNPLPRSTPQSSPQKQVTTQNPSPPPPSRRLPPPSRKKTTLLHDPNNTVAETVQQCCLVPTTVSPDFYAQKSGANSQNPLSVPQCPFWFTSPFRPAICQLLTANCSLLPSPCLRASVPSVVHIPIPSRHLPTAHRQLLTPPPLPHPKTIPYSLFVINS